MRAKARSFRGCMDKKRAHERIQRRIREHKERDAHNREVQFATYLMETYPAEFPTRGAAYKALRKP
jgi:hypothetical protein